MKKYSIAIFGSSLRDDFDKYSDKDLLIVAEDYETLKKLKEVHSKQNWSISFYTYSKLKYLSENGSLFIKHLQKESKIIVDINKTFTEILSSYKPKPHFENDIVDSRKYFNILKYVPKTDLGIAWFCDSFYVGLRNYLIFINARDDVFEFSYVQLLNILKAEKKIDHIEYKLLKELRVVKRNYRENITTELPSYSFAKQISHIAEKLELLKPIEFIDSSRFQNFIENTIIDGGFNSYQKLRLVEGYYRSKEIDIPKIMKIISNPQFYASKMKDDNYTLKLITDLKNDVQQRINVIRADPKKRKDFDFKKNILKLNR